MYLPIYLSTHPSMYLSISISTVYNIHIHPLFSHVCLVEHSTTSTHFLLTCSSTVSKTNDPLTAVGHSEEKTREANGAEPERGATCSV